MDHIHDDAFVTEKLAPLTPGWTTDLTRGRSRFEARLQTWRTPHRLVAVGAAVMVILAVALMPIARTYAQDVWARWTLTRVDVLVASISHPFRVSMHGGRSFSTLADAERAASFALHLPTAGVTGVPTTFSVFDVVVMDQVMDRTSLESALSRAGAADEQVPPEWDLASIRAHVPNAVLAYYADGLVVAQSAPLSLDVPVGIPLHELATTVFRAAGMTREAAVTAGLEYATRPAWLLYVPSGERTRVERLTLANGEAWLVAERAADANSETVFLIHVSASHLYAVAGPDRDRAIAAIETLP